MVNVYKKDWTTKGYPVKYKKVSGKYMKNEGPQKGGTLS